MRWVSLGPGTALAVTAVTLAVHHLEGYIVGPLVVRQHTGTHPLILMLALVAGIKLGGIAGGFLAGPLVVAAVGAFPAPHPDQAATPTDGTMRRGEASTDRPEAGG